MCMGLRGCKEDVIIISDRFSKYKACYALKGKTAADAMYGILDFMGDRCIQRMYCDNSGELENACKNLGIPREKSLPGIPRSNARAERVNRDVLDGTRTLLIHAGLPGAFWPFAANRYCHMDNIRKAASGSSPWTITHGGGFLGQEIPFGAAVVYLLAETKHSGAHHKWGARWPFRSISWI